MKEKIDIERAKHLYNNGLTLSVVGLEFGVDRMTITRLFKAIGFEVRHSGPVSKKSKLTKSKQHVIKLCSCCGKRGVPTKPIDGVILTKLCVECYKAGGDAQSNCSNVTTRFNNDDNMIGWY